MALTRPQVRRRWAIHLALMVVSVATFVAFTVNLGRFDPSFVLAGSLVATILVLVAFFLERLERPWCPRCQAEVRPRAMYCPRCGTGPLMYSTKASNKFEEYYEAQWSMAMGFITVAMILVFALLGGFWAWLLTPTVTGFVGWVILAALLYTIVESVRTWLRLRQAL